MANLLVLGLFFSATLFSPACLVAATPTKTTTLLVGDSVDRFTVQAWCQHHGVSRKEWGSHSVRYVNKNIAHPPQYCHFERGNSSLALASVHIYGTNATGPYYGGFINNANDPYADTTPRMRKALELFVAEFGAPDYVFFHSAQWDIRGLASNWGHISAELNASMLQREVDTYRRNLNARIDELEAMTKTVAGAGRPSPITVGLRTAAYSSHVENAPMQHDFNAVIRATADTRHMPLLDLDLDLWSWEDFARNNTAAEARLFRDFIHPRDQFLAAAGDKLLNTLYSRYAFFPSNFVNTSSYTVLQPFVPATRAAALHLLLNLTSVAVRLLRHGNDSFYYCGVGDGGARVAWRLKSPSDAEAFRQWLRSGPSEELPLPAAVDVLHNSSHLRLLELYPPIEVLLAPPDRPGPPLALQTSAGQLYLVGAQGWRDGDGLRRVPRADVLPYFGISPDAIMRNVDIVLTLPHENFGVADMFRNNTLIRFYKDREIFWVYNQSRHSFPNFDTFVSWGLDTGDVVICYQAQDMELLPVGPPVEPKQQH